MPSRVIRAEYPSSPSLAVCSPAADDHFPRYWLAADDYGCFEILPGSLRSTMFPHRADVTDAQIVSELNEYAARRAFPGASELLEVWRENGRLYGFLRSWCHQQRRRPEPGSTGADPKLKRKTPMPPSVRPFGGLIAYHERRACGRRLSRENPQILLLPSGQCALNVSEPTSGVPAGAVAGAHQSPYSPPKGDDCTLSLFPDLLPEKPAATEVPEVRPPQESVALAPRDGEASLAPPHPPVQPQAATVEPAPVEKSGRERWHRNADPLAPQVREVFDHWVRVMGKSSDSNLSRDRWRFIRARLREGYSVEQLKRAVDGCKASPFHMGENDRKTPYNGCRSVFKNADTVEQLVAIADGVAKPAAPRPLRPPCARGCGGEVSPVRIAGQPADVCVSCHVAARADEEFGVKRDRQPERAPVGRSA